MDFPKHDNQTKNNNDTNNYNAGNTGVNLLNIDDLNSQFAPNSSNINNNIKLLNVGNLNRVQEVSKNTYLVTKYDSLNNVVSTNSNSVDNVINNENNSQMKKNMPHHDILTVNINPEIKVNKLITETIQSPIVTNLSLNNKNTENQNAKSNLAKIQPCHNNGNKWNSV